MPFQSSVNIQYGFGVVGERIVDGPERVESLQLDTNGGTIGRFFTKANGTGVATQGGTITNGSIVMAGILVAPKNHALQGTTAGTLVPTLALPGFAQGGFMTMGTVIVPIANAGNIGDIIEYNLTDGTLKAKAPGATVDPGYAYIPNCVVYRYPVTNSGGGLTAIRITN